MKPWYFRRARLIVYLGTMAGAVGIVAASLSGSQSSGHFLVSARQLFGLWALGFLLASLLLGPLTFTLPWLPLKSALLYARRAVGISAFVFAVAHVTCYACSVLLRNWREIYTPGLLWIGGLLLGLFALADLAVLAVTSRDATVKRLGGRRWKKLHQSVYVALAVILLHALFTGADFGLNSGPDVQGEPDAGAGITFFCLSIAWLVLFVLRRNRIIWRPSFTQKPIGL